MLTLEKRVHPLAILVLACFVSISRQLSLHPIRAIIPLREHPDLIYVNPCKCAPGVRRYALQCHSILRFVLRVLISWLLVL